MRASGESGTLARRRKNRSEHLDSVLKKYSGRLVKLTGALVEFASAVDALSAAIGFQQAIVEANREQPSTSLGRSSKACCPFSRRRLAHRPVRADPVMVAMQFVTGHGSAGGSFEVPGDATINSSARPARNSR